MNYKFTLIIICEHFILPLNEIYCMHDLLMKGLNCNKFHCHTPYILTITIKSAYYSRVVQFLSSALKVVVPYLYYKKYLQTLDRYVYTCIIIFFF